MVWLVVVTLVCLVKVSRVVPVVAVVVGVLLVVAAVLVVLVVARLPPLQLPQLECDLESVDVKLPVGARLQTSVATSLLPPRPPAGQREGLVGGRNAGVPGLLQLLGWFQ